MNEQLVNPNLYLQSGLDHYTEVLYEGIFGGVRALVIYWFEFTLH
jgi:hypothetical protein